MYIYILEDLGCKMESLIIRHTLFFWCLLLHPFRQIKIPQLTAIKHLSHHIHITYHIIIYHIYIYITAHHNVFSMFSLTKNLSTQRKRYQTSLSPANGAAKYGWDSRLVGDHKIQMWARLSSWNLKKKDGWLVVEPTHLKNMFVNLEMFPKCRGENQKP